MENQIVDAILQINSVMIPLTIAEMMLALLIYDAIGSVIHRLRVGKNGN